MASPSRVFPLSFLWEQEGTGWPWQDKTSAGPREHSCVRVRGKTVESLRHMFISCQLPVLATESPTETPERTWMHWPYLLVRFVVKIIWKFLIQIQHSQFCATNPKDQVVSLSNPSLLSFLLHDLMFFLLWFSSVHNPRWNAPNPCPTHSCLKIYRSGSLIDSNNLGTTSI